MQKRRLFCSLALTFLGLTSLAGPMAADAQTSRTPVSAHHKASRSGKRLLPEHNVHLLYRLKIPGATRGNGSGDLLFSPDNTLLAFANWDNLTLWDMKTGRMRKILAHGVESVAFSPNGKLVCGFRDLEPGENRPELMSVRIWDVKTGKLRASHQLQESGGGVAFTPNGRMVGVGQYDTIVMYRMPHLKKIKTIGPSQWATMDTIAFSSDAKLVAGVTDSKEEGPGAAVYIWHLPSGKPVAFKGGDDVEDIHDATTFLPTFFLPSGRQLVCGDCLLDLNQRHPSPHFILPVHGRTNLGQFRRGTALVGFLAGKNTLEVWNVVRRRRVAVWDPMSVPNMTSTAFSSDGHLLAISYDRYVKVWRLPRTCLR